MSIVHRSFASNLWQLFVLLALVVLGVGLGLAGIIDWRKLLHLAQGYTHYWWLLPLLILIQITLYTFAMPGSMILWVVAPLYEPLVAIPALVAGSVIGAMLAYAFARREVRGWVAHVQRSRFFTILQDHGNFLTVCALRAMPNFPQSVVSYGAGILHLPIGSFLAATLIGFTLKNTLYCSAIFGAINVADPWDLLSLDTFAPLILIVVLLILAQLFQVRWTAARKKDQRRKWFRLP